MPRITFSSLCVRLSAFVIIGASFCLTSGFAQSNQSTAKKDRVYANAAMVDLGATGAYLKTRDGFELVPWAELSNFQVGTIRNSFQDALYNIRLKTSWVKGEVFNVVEGEGVVVSTKLVADDNDDAGEEAPDHRRGAEVISGMVFFKDLPQNLEEGAAIETYAYDTGSVLEFDIGFGKKDLKIYTIAKPAWAKATEWSDSKGRKMLAELIEVANGQCRFLRNNAEFLFPLDQLIAADQQRAIKQKELMRVIPLPGG